MFIKKYFDKSETKNKEHLLINSVFALFPIGFIFGSLFVDLNLITFCLLGIFYLKPKIYEIKLNFTLKIILLFFIIIFFSTSIGFIKSLYVEEYDKDHLIRLVKSLLFFRFFLLLIIVYFLNKYNFLNFKFFFITVALSTLLISVDVIYQYIFGYNIIGLKSLQPHNSSFFGTELIAGNFIQRFSIFSVLFTSFVLKNNKYTKYFVTIIIICILAAGILFSGNRMPLIIFLFGLFLFFIFDIKIKKIVTLGLISSLTLLFFIISSNEKLKANYYNSYYAAVKSMAIAILPDILKKKMNVDKGIKTENDSVKGGYWKTSENGEFYVEMKYPYNYETPQQRLFLTAVDTWKMNKIFGGGIKSFRINCQKLATTPPTFTEEQLAKIKSLYEEEKLGEATHLIEKVLEQQVGVPGTPETNMAENFVRFKKNRLCSGHPHNYYLEILTEAGIIGFASTLSIAILFLVFLFKNFRHIKGINLQQNILLASVISLALEMFPMRSTGSIFTTNNATYLILIASILLCYEKILKINNK